MTVRACAYIFGLCVRVFVCACARIHVHVYACVCVHADGFNMFDFLSGFFFVCKIVFNCHVEGLFVDVCVLAVGISRLFAVQYVIWLAF